MKILKKKFKKFEIEMDILYRKYILSFGLDMGSNILYKGKIPRNFFIEVGILFWTFGFEVNWK